MARLTAFIHLTLDGVMQAPGRPDEDPRGDFPYGGWSVPYQAMAPRESMAATGALLFGRRTYQDFYAVWPRRTDGNPFTEVLNNTPKYVASRTLHEPLPWSNSILLQGDLAEAVRKLKGELERDIVVLGSGDLMQTLMRHNLVDQYVLNIHPLVLGTGRRLFEDGGAHATLNLVSASPTPTGVIVTTYQPAE